MSAKGNDSGGDGDLCNVGGGLGGGDPGKGGEGGGLGGGHGGTLTQIFRIFDIL